MPPGLLHGLNTSYFFYTIRYTSCFFHNKITSCGAHRAGYTQPPPDREGQAGRKGSGKPRSRAARSCVKRRCQRCGGGIKLWKPSRPGQGKQKKHLSIMRIRHKVSEVSEYFYFILLKGHLTQKGWPSITVPQFTVIFNCPKKHKCLRNHTT